MSAQPQEISKQQTDLLFGLIHVGPSLLKKFVTRTHEDLSIISTHFKSARASNDFRYMIEPVLRSLHNIKGSAALFDLTLYINAAHQLESRMLHMRELDDGVMADYLGQIELEITGLEGLLQQTDQLIEQLIQLQATGAGRQSKTQAFIDSSLLLIEELSKRYQNRVYLSYKQFNLDMAPVAYQQLLLDCLTQLTRNAVVHGIETMDERKAAGKNYKGCLYLSSKKIDGYYRFTVQDDGRGLDVEKLRAVALRNGKTTAENMSAVELAELIFSPGFSTTVTQSKAAGRGVGMDLVSDLVTAVGGYLEFTFTRGHGCAFSLFLPDADPSSIP